MASTKFRLRIRKKDWVVVGVGALISVGVAGIKGALVGSWLSFLVLEIFRRVEEMHEARRRDFQQVEALLSLLQVIHPRVPLPAMRGWVVSPDLASLITQIVLTKKPSTVLDLGSGVSTIIVGYALEQLRQGRVIGVDHEASFAAKTRSLIAQHGLDTVASVREAPLQSGWYDLDIAALPSIDLLIVDGPPARSGPRARWAAVPKLYERLSEGAVIVCDDIRSEIEKDMIQEWVKQFPDLSVEYVDLEKGAAVLTKHATNLLGSPTKSK